MPSLYLEEMRILCLRSSPDFKTDVSAQWRRRWWGGCWAASGPLPRATSPRCPCCPSWRLSTRTGCTACCPEVCCTAGATLTPGSTAPPSTPHTTSSSSAWRTWWALTFPSDKHLAGSPATGSPSSSTGPAAPGTTSGRRRWRAPGNVVLLNQPLLHSTLGRSRRVRTFSTSLELEIKMLSITDMFAILPCPW